jgi:Na+-translocating ferredoxin:NAD+ oxidoreductase RnfG subunit
MSLRPIPALIALIPAGISIGAHAAEYLTIPAAQKSLFPTAEEFVPATLVLSDEQRQQIKELSGGRQRADQQVWQAKRGGETLGWFIVDDVVGKHEFITYAVGITPAGAVSGLEVLVYRETYGYQIREREWREQFKGRTLADSFKLNDGIANITGATLSCRNVSNGVKRLLALYKVALDSKR